MARPREFDIDDALENAMQAFWSYGYEATSMSDLMEAMDLQKGSIYKAFGDKHSLFIAALEHYLNAVHEFDRKILEKGESPKKAIRTWLNTDLKNACSQSLKRGCLMVNALNERAYRDEKVANLITLHTARLSKMLTKTIKRGQELKEFRSDINASDISQVIIVSLFGMLTLTKGPMNKTASLNNVKNILKLIENK
ncbi:MAG: TetR/AcrR family transcriptional regulator [Gammaproteobacteria bacterium]|nr:TetR/AcrR family transcriptional regulator [Gammaproteobacteria bacterium]